MNNDDNRLNLPVFLTLQDGRELTIDLIVNLGGAIDRTMNNDARYILVGEADGSERLIAKSMITEVRDAKKSRQPSAIAPATTTATVAAPGIVPEFADPHQVLGVSPVAGVEEIRNAFVEQAQAYNPDRLAHVGLPADVTEFCANRYRQISEAYATLTEGQTPALADRTMMTS